MEAFRRQVYPKQSHISAEAYETATMRSRGYLVVDLYPTAQDSCSLRTNIFSGENNQLHPNNIFHTSLFSSPRFPKREKSGLLNNLQKLVQSNVIT